MVNKMKKKLIKNSFIVLIILVAMGLTFPMIAKNLKFGLDLQGGFEVLYQVKGIDGKKVTPSVITGTYKTILKRIDILGVNEPVIIVEGNDRIRVQLAGINNQDEARKILSQAATLTFRDVNDNLLMTSSVLKSGGAKIGQDEKGGYAVSLSVTDKDEFYKVTKKISESQDNRIVIWLDFDENKNSFLSTNNGSLCGSTGSNCLSAATVSQGFASDVIISGNFKYEEVEQLVDLINSGSLSVKLEEISSKTVTASFGEGTLDKTFKAGIIGILLVLVLIITIFNFSGLIASICIVAYTYFTLLSFWLFGGVLTLPGIAALIIGIGMAIDAPVITFSRIKDELAKGSKLQVAYENGNKNSFMSIFDSNFTTLIVGVILFIFGESAIKGFATMLIISILVTMLIMVLFNRYLLALFVKTGYFDDKLKLFIKFNRNKKVPFYQKMDFIKYRKYFYAGTTILIIIGIVSFFTNGLNLGIDFKSGTSIAVSSNETIDVKKLENDINQFGYSVYENEKMDNSLIFKVNETLTEDNIAEMTNHFKEKYNIDSEIGVVSNIVSKGLVKNAFISFIIAIVAIGIYVSFRFEFNYSISGIIALIHDVLMVVIFFSIFKLEVTSIFIASILSIIGYSINDTVVTFDKMREITKEKYKNTIKSKDDYKDIVNTSLKTVLERTIITTLTTICPVIGLMLFGPAGIINFNISMLFGLIFGVYSSIFLACQLWYDFSKKKIGKITKKKWFDEDEVEELRIKGINA